MTYQDYEKLGYYDLKGKMVEYVQKRLAILKQAENKSEFDYCKIQGQIEELHAMIKFLHDDKHVDI